MNLSALYDILNETTAQFRKGPEVAERLTAGGVLKVTEIYAMPPEDAARQELDKVDLEFVVVGVDRTKAEVRKDELVSILRQYPRPERLAMGPSYIEVGAEIGDQGAALQLFALGKILGLWDVITPRGLGMAGDEAREMAGRGLIMISGFSPQNKEPAENG